MFAKQSALKRPINGSFIPFSSILSHMKGNDRIEIATLQPEILDSAWETGVMDDLGVALGTFTRPVCTNGLLCDLKVG